MALKFTDNNYDNYTQQSDKLTVIDFWAEWCAPCRVMGPIVEELSNQYQGKVNIGKLNVDENGNAASQFEIRSIPTVIFFRDGREVKRIVGAQSKATLEKEIQARM